MSTYEGLRLLARQPTWRWWTLGSFLARLPVTMTLLALVLLGERVAGSLAVGAQLSGVAMLSSGALALWRGRMLDRGELTSGLRRDALLTAVVLAALAISAGLGAPTPLLFVLAAGQGVAMAGLSGGFRALLPVIVPPADLPRANVVEAIFVEVAFVTGPALAGVLALVVGPVGVLGTMAAAAAGAATIVSFLPRLYPPEERPPFAPWRVRGVRPVLALALALGAAVGSFESIIPARVVALGSDAEIAGPLLALLAAGSGIGGLAASARAEAVVDVRRPAAWLLLAIAVAMAPGALVPSVLLLGLVLFIAGGPIAPLNALGTLRLQGIVPRGRQAEGFSIYIASVTIGVGVGQTVVGQLLPALGPERLVLGAAAIPLVAGLVVAIVIGRSSSIAAVGPQPADPSG